MSQHKTPAPARRNILRRPEVEAKTGLARSTIYLYIEKGTFPAPVKLGLRSVGWIETEVEDWIASRERMQPTVRPPVDPIDMQAA